MGAIGKTLENIGDQLERVVDKSLGLDVLYEEELQKDCKVKLVSSIYPSKEVQDDIMKYMKIRHW